MSRVSDIIEQVTTLLHDGTNVRWPRVELLQFLNDGQKQIAIFRPDASSKSAPLQLVEGTKQAIDDVRAIRFLQARRNLGLDGLTPGRAIRKIDFEAMDATNPDWHSTIGAVVKHYIHDEREPKTFYVYPGQPAIDPIQVDVLYSVVPVLAELSGINGVTEDVDPSINEVYDTALISYIQYKAFSKNSEFAAHAALASNHYQAFATILGIKTQKDKKYAPVNNVGPHANPNRQNGGRAME